VAQGDRGTGTESARRVEVSGAWRYLFGLSAVAPRSESAARTGAPVQLEAAYEPVPGTLARLRYGYTCNARHRPADLTGAPPFHDDRTCPDRSP
jgi:hypothetical protein